MTNQKSHQIRPHTLTWESFYYYYFAFASHPHTTCPIFVFFRSFLLPFFHSFFSPESWQIGPAHQTIIWWTQVIELILVAPRGLFISQNDCEERAFTEFRTNNNIHNNLGPCKHISQSPWNQFDAMRDSTTAELVFKLLSAGPLSLPYLMVLSLNYFARFRVSYRRIFASPSHLPIVISFDLSHRPGLTVVWVRAASEWFAASRLRDDVLPTRSLTQIEFYYYL